MFVKRLRVQVSSLACEEKDHFMHLPTGSTWQKNPDFIGAWTVDFGRVPYAVSLELQTKADGSDIRGCCMIQRLNRRENKCSNTPDVTLTSETDKTGEHFLKPRLQPGEWVKLETEIARRRITVEIADGCIRVGRLSDPKFLERVLTVADLAAHVRR